MTRRSPRDGISASDDIYLPSRPRTLAIGVFEAEQRSAWTVQWQHAYEATNGAPLGSGLLAEEMDEWPDFGPESFVRHTLPDEWESAVDCEYDWWRQQMANVFEREAVGRSRRADGSAPYLRLVRRPPADERDIGNPNRYGMEPSEPGEPVWFDGFLSGMASGL